MKHEKRFIVDVLFVLALFGVFTISALMLVTIGAEVYRHTVDDMRHNYETRTSVAYITEKIHQNDTLINNNGSWEGSVNISTLASEPALVLKQIINGEMYSTYLYLHDGYLKELFMKSGTYLGEDTLSAGQEIMELSEFNMEQISDNLLSIKIVSSQGDIHTIYTSVRCTP